MGWQVPGRGTSSAGVEPRIILPPMDPPTPPLTFGRPLVFRLVLRLQAVGTTHCLRTTCSVMTLVPSSRATTTGPSGAFVTMVKPFAPGSVIMTLVCAAAGIVSPMAPPTKAAIKDLFRMVISAPFLAGATPTLDNAPAGYARRSVPSELKTVRRGFFFIGKRNNIAIPGKRSAQ